MSDMPRYIVTATVQTTTLDEDGTPTDPPFEALYYTGDILPLALAALMSAATDGERPYPQFGWTHPRTIGVHMKVLTDEEARAADDRAAHMARLRAASTAAMTESPLCSFCGTPLVNEDCPRYGSGPDHDPYVPE